MTETEHTKTTEQAQKSPAKPRVGQRSRRHTAWVWLIPLVAAVIGASIVWRHWANQGPTIQISFHSASGIEAGKTQVKFRDVVIGMVTDIALSKNRENVIVTAQLDKDAEALAHEQTQFWVVKPTVGVTGISGLATLLSGPYIEADTKADTGADTTTKAGKFEFVGLERPPPIASDRPGSRFKLRAASLGSIEPGTPVYFLQIPVGVVTNYKLDENGKFVDIDVFVDAPYDKYVNASSRFWNESGVQLGMGPNGFQLQIGSLASLLSSGISFASFGPNHPVPEDKVFKLFASHEQAKSLPEGPSVAVQMRFDQSTRGLDEGAPIDFHGLHIGVIESVELDIDQAEKKFYTRVRATLYPAMLGAAYDTIKQQNRNPQTLGQIVLQAVDRGMRAQLQQSNLLTGGLYIKLVNGSDQPANVKNTGKLPIRIPTIPSQTIEDLQKQIAQIIEHIDKIPFEQIGKELETSLKELTAVGKSLNQTLTPELAQTLKDMQTTLDEVNGLLASSKQIPDGVEQSIQQLDDVLRSTRQLVDEIRQKPNSLLFGEPATSYSRETLGADR
jgi:paraquat-inducible protein B